MLLVLGLLATACTAAPSAPKNTGAATSSTSAGDHGATATATTAPNTTTTATPSPVAANVVSGRSAVPWSQIGPGWLLATWSPKVTSLTGQGTGSATLLLVDPASGRYDLGAAPSTRLIDWSGSGTDALFLVSPTSGTVASSQFVVETLRTGSQHAFSTPTGATDFEAQFSKPAGTAVLVGGVPSRRYGLSGMLEEAYPVSLPGEGAASKASGTLAETPSGTQLVLQASGGLDVVTNAGAPVRFLPPPPGQTECGLDGWWTGDDVLETCASDLYAQPVTGGTASVVATGKTGGQYIDAWTVGGQVVAEQGACGTTWLVIVEAGGSTQRVTVPGAGSVLGIGVDGTRLAALVTPSCDEPPTNARQGNLLDWYTPSSGTLRTALGGAFGRGTVDAAVVEDDR